MSSLSGALDESALNRSVAAANDVKMLGRSPHSGSDSERDGGDEEMTDLFGQDDIMREVKRGDRFA
jgi:hypothetical protein